MAKRIRAIITDAGLAKRLGQKVHVNRKGIGEASGTLVYYPDRFAVKPKTEENLYSIRKGDSVILRIGVGRRHNPNNFDHFLATYVYVGESSY